MGGRASKKILDVLGVIKQHLSKKKISIFPHLISSRIKLFSLLNLLSTECDRTSFSFCVKGVTLFIRYTFTQTSIHTLAALLNNLFWLLH